MFMFDFILFRFVGPWPLSFFFEMPGNPILWRYHVGFRDQEVYVRESRGWGTEDLLGAAEGSSGKAGSESPFFKTRILPAVDIHRLRAKSTCKESAHLESSEQVLLEDGRETIGRSPIEQPEMMCCTWKACPKTPVTVGGSDYF